MVRMQTLKIPIARVVILLPVLQNNHWVIDREIIMPPIMALQVAIPDKRNKVILQILHSQEMLQVQQITDQETQEIQETQETQEMQEMQGRSKGEQETPEMLVMLVMLVMLGLKKLRPVVQGLNNNLQVVQEINKLRQVLRNNNQMVIKGKEYQKQKKV
jgi:hypothetical protein